MSRTNPRKAIDALTPSTISADGVALAPMTLGMWAVLEKIGSPLLTGEDVDTLSWLPTLYLLTHDPREALMPGLADKSLEWANGQPVTVVDAIRSAAMRQMGVVEDVLPQVEKKKTKKNADTTDGSSSGLTSRRGATAGPTKTSSGGRRQARSRSSRVATGCAKTKYSRSAK